MFKHSVILHVQSKITLKKTWVKLTIMFESKDAITKMCLKNKLQTSKMKEGDNMTKHMHKFTSLLEQLSLARTPISIDEAMSSLLKSMPMSYKKIINSLKRWPNLIVQALITNILQEKIMMKNLNYALYIYILSSWCKKKTI